MRRKKKKWKIKEGKEVKKRKENKSGGGDDAVRDDVECDEVWNLVKKQEKHREAEELKHKVCKETEEEENKTRKENEGKQEEDKEVKKAKKIIGWLERELYKRGWIANLEDIRKEKEEKDDQEGREQRAVWQRRGHPARVDTWKGGGHAAWRGVQPQDEREGRQLLQGGGQDENN